MKNLIIAVLLSIVSLGAYAVDRYDAMGVTVLSDNGMTSRPRVYVGGALVVDAHPDGWKKVAVNYSISGDVSQVNSVAITGTAIHADNGYGGITKIIHAEPSTLNMRTLPYEIISVDPLITVFSVQGEHHIVTWTRAYPF